MPPGNAQLLLHQIAPRHHLADRVFNLNAGIDLDEIDLAAQDIVEELAGSGVAIVDAFGEAYRRCIQLRTQGIRHGDTGRFLDNLLVAALHRAVTLAKVDDFARTIADELHFDMARLGDEALHEQGAVVERGQGFGVRAVESGLDFNGAFHDHHAAPAAACCGLEQNRIADIVCEFAGIGGVGDLAASRYQRHSGGGGHFAGAQLVAESVDHLGLGADEDNAMLLAQPRQLGPFGQETIARMQRIAAARLGRLHHQHRIEVALCRRSRPQHKAAIRQPCRRAAAIRIGHADHGLKIEPLRRANHTKRYFTAIGHKNA